MAHSSRTSVILALALILVATTYVLAELLIFGRSNFLTTALVYITSGIGFGMALRARPNMALAVLSTMSVLFVSEVFLRFVRKSPITYSEMNGVGYVSMYRADVADNWTVLTLEGRNDVHTLQWPPFETRTNASIDFQFPDYTTNALGLRGELPSAGSRILLAVGDSFTEGAGTPNDSTYPKLLEEQLRHGDTTWAVLNAGVSGNDPFLDWMMVQKLHAEYRFEHLLFMVNTSDIHDVMTRGGLERFHPSGRLEFPDGPWWEPIYAVSFVSRLFFKASFGVGMNLLTPEQEAERRTLALAALHDLFSHQVAPFVARHGIAAHIVTMPMKYEAMGDQDDYRELTDALRDIPGVSFTDCRPMFTEGADIDGLYWPRDGHLRPAGYAQLALCAYQQLLNSKKIPGADAVGKDS